MMGPRTIAILRLPLAVAALGVLGGCTVALQRDQEQCRTSKDCQHLAAAAVCTSLGVCESLTVDRAGAGCASDRDCPGAWSICYQNACHQLDQAPCLGLGTPESPATSRAGERLPFAMLVPAEEVKAGAGDAMAPTIGVASTVLHAFAAAREETVALPELVGVACPESDPAALQRLKDAGVRLVIGAMRGDVLVAAAEGLQREAVLFAASTDAPVLLDQSERLASDIVSCKPNSRDSQLAHSAAVAFVQAHLSETGRLASGAATVVAMSLDEEGLGYSLEGPTLGQVRYDNQHEGEDLVRALAAHPGLIVAPSGFENWSYNVKAVERGWQLAELELPYYLLQEKQASALDVVGNGPERLAYRTVVLDFALSPATLANQKGFAREYEAATGHTARHGLDYVHDCLYVALYAALAAELRFGLSARELSAKSVLLGLDALSGGDERINVGERDIERAFERLRSSGGLSAAINLTGGSGELDFESSLDALRVVPSQLGFFVRPRAGDSELYCVDPKLSQFCDTGLRFPTTGEPVAGDSRCDCF